MKQKITFDFSKQYPSGIIPDDEFVIDYDLEDRMYHDYAVGSVHIVNKSGKVIHTITIDDAITITLPDGKQYFTFNGFIGIDNEGCYSTCGHIFSDAGERINIHEKIYHVKFPQTLLHKAVTLATNKFRLISDKGRKPTIFHLIHVMGKGQTEKEKIAGVLHELFEGHIFKEEEILQVKNDFGDEIYDALRILPMTKEEKDFIQAIEWLIRLRNYGLALTRTDEGLVIEKTINYQEPTSGYIDGCLKDHQSNLNYYRKRYGESFIEKALVTSTMKVYLDYIRRIKSNKLARKVKMRDLEHDMDLSRIKPPLSENDYLRTEKYKMAFLELCNFISAGYYRIKFYILRIGSRRT